METIYLLTSYLFSYLFIYIWYLFLTLLVTNVKPNISSAEVHPQLSNNGHPVDGALVGAGSLWLVAASCLWEASEVNFLWFCKAGKVDTAFIKHELIIKHFFGRSFSILLHFEWFKSTFSSSTNHLWNAKPKGAPKKNSEENKFIFKLQNAFIYLFILTPPTSLVHNSLSF